MFKTLLVYAHLLATCAAIGTIVLTDLRLLAKVTGYRVVIPPPERFEARIITMALVLLYITGACIVFMGVSANPEYLANQKLQAKLVLVGLLTLNAWALHKVVFPILNRSRPVSAWTPRNKLMVASSVSLSNSMWFFCAFLGVARPWNGTVAIGYVLAIAVLVWASLFVSVMAVLKFASRDEPKPQPDWIDSMKATLSDFAGLSQH